MNTRTNVVQHAFAVINLLAAFLVWCGPARAVRYATTDLGTLAGSDGVALAVDDEGQVIGVSDTGAVVRARVQGADPSAFALAGPHAFLWSLGVIGDLGTLPEGGYCVPTAINDNGQVVGQDEKGQQGVLWPNGMMTRLHTALPSGRLGLWLYDINNKGEGVGARAGRKYGALPLRHGMGTYLNKLVPEKSGLFLRVPYGINDRGQIVGGAAMGGQEHAFLLHSVPLNTRHPGLHRKRVLSVTRQEGGGPRPASASKLINAVTKDPQAAKVSELLRKVRNDITANRLTSPKGNCAADKLKKILGSDPMNKDALALRSLIVSKYIRWARRAASHGNFSRAKIYLRKASAVDAGDADIAAAGAQLRQAQADWEERRAKEHARQAASARQRREQEAIQRRSVAQCVASCQTVLNSCVTYMRSGFGRCVSRAGSSCFQQSQLCLQMSRQQQNSALSGTGTVGAILGTIVTTTRGVSCVDEQSTCQNAAEASCGQTLDFNIAKCKSGASTCERQCQ